MAAGGVRFEVRGADTLARTLKAAAADLQDMRGANVDAGRVLAASAQARAPRRTGRLAGSVRSSATPTGVEVTAGAPYAGYQNWGTRHNRATYFLTGALDTAVEPIYAKAVDQAIAQVRGI
jgi:HK97 gp10 family phage protein